MTLTSSRVPVCAVTGRRFSPELEKELIKYGGVIGFKSHYWVSEVQRRCRCLCLRDVGDVPFCPTTTFHRKGVLHLMNTVFMEETDLFLFFMLRPLPTRKLSASTHWLFVDCKWEAFHERHGKYSQLAGLMGQVNCSLRNGRASLLPSVAESQRGTGCAENGAATASDFVESGEIHGAAGRTRVQQLISPPSVATFRQADYFWVCQSNVFSHRLALTSNAVWSPLFSERVHCDCMYNMDQIKGITGCLRSLNFQ
uniref:Uncharacterized protein n=1 Tax=Trypanosoma congolense (strain IL3000) TaxID=1068625 RepID=G0UNS3_TRYCI|nr:conserved hypothetical protein [Trypanosoma congolense IL3000]